MRKPEHPNVGRAGFILPTFTQNQRALHSSDLQSLSDGVGARTLTTGRSDASLQMRQTSSGVFISSASREPFDPDQFEVKWINGDTFNIRGGNCQFVGYECNFTVGEPFIGTPMILSQYGGSGASNFSVTRPVVWSGSRPKAPTTANANQTNMFPTFAEDYFVCPRASASGADAKSDHWSVIIGLPVPSFAGAAKPNVYIVPRVFAGTNLRCGYTPYYSIRNQSGMSYSQSYEGEININQGSSLTGDLESGYSLENISGPMPSHYHGYTTVTGCVAKWTEACFCGLVLAHMDWDDTKKEWKVTQYHKGNVTLLSFASIKDVGQYATGGEVPFDWVNSFADTADRYWSTSSGVTDNMSGINQGAGLRHQLIEHGSTIFW